MMKALCFAIFACAFNLLLGYTAGCFLRPCGLPRQRGRLRHRLAGQGAGPLWSHGRRARAAFGGAGLVCGLIAIRRQGIYFAMITLAMAQMVYFVWLQAPFTGGGDGCRACRAAAARPVDLERHGAVLRGAGGLRRGVPVHRPRGAFAVRPGLKGDPRERAARHLAGLRRRHRTSCWPSCCPPRLAGLAGSLKTLVLGFAPRCRTRIGRSPARWC